jgi:hypothetical protein
MLTAFDLLLLCEPALLLLLRLLLLLLLLLLQGCVLPAQTALLPPT